MAVKDGYEATRKIREINPDIAIVALSAYVMKFDRVKASESGCNDFMPKPVYGNQLRCSKSTCNHRAKRFATTLTSTQGLPDNGRNP